MNVRHTNISRGSGIERGTSALQTSMVTNEVNNIVSTNLKDLSSSFPKISVIHVIRNNIDFNVIKKDQPISQLEEISLWNKHGFRHCFEDIAL